MPPAARVHLVAVPTVPLLHWSTSAHSPPAFGFLKKRDQFYHRARNRDRRSAIRSGFDRRPTGPTKIAPPPVSGSMAAIMIQLRTDSYTDVRFPSPRDPSSMHRQRPVAVPRVSGGVVWLGRRPPLARPIA